MNVLFIILNDLDLLDNILEDLYHIGIKGATIIDSEGMASALRHEPMFKMLFTGPFQKSDDDQMSKTIFSVIENIDKYDEAVTLVKKHLESSTYHSSGFMFSVPVSNIYPISKH